MSTEPMHLTRQQLYAEVWAEPMVSLAGRYGLSDVGLAKICRKHRIPVPYRGYWRKKEVGQHVRQTPLPKLHQSSGAELKEISLYHAPPGAAVMEESGPIAEQAGFEARAENQIRVSEALEDPHPLIAQSVVALRRAKPDAQGYLQPKSTSCLSVRITLDSADRAMCILDALLKALEARGHMTRIQSGERPATIVRVGEEDVNIALEERVNRVELAPPGRTARRHTAWSWPQYEWKATGQLSLKIENVWREGLRRTWADGKQQRVEDRLNAFIVGLVAAAELLKEQRLEREARDRAWRAEEQRQALELKRQQEEASRIRALDRAVISWRKSQLVRAYISDARMAAEKQGQLTPGSPIADWLGWAQGYADRIDPLWHASSVPEDPEPHRSREYDWQRRPAREASPEPFADLEAL